MSSTTPSPLPTVAELVEMLQTAFPLPFQWQTQLRNLGISAGAEFSPTEMAELTKSVFWRVKQTGMEDPAGWLASRRARLSAVKTPAGSTKSRTPAEVAAAGPTRKDSVQLEVPRPGQSLAKTSDLAPPAAAHETTKAEVLRRAKAAIDAADTSLRGAAEALDLAQKNFNASQREIAEAVGRSASWVNRLLKWHRSGYKECSPFGPTTQAARVSHAQRAVKRRKSKAKTATTSADAESSESSANSAASSSETLSAAEAKRNLMDAISQWWPYLDSAGKAEVASFFRRQKAGL